MKNLVTTLALFIATFSIAQEPSKEIEEPQIEPNKTFFIIKTKVGISQLELFDESFTNGTMTQVDLLLLSKLSNKFEMEYGLSFAQFTGNNFNNNKYGSVKNNNIRIPVNFLYNQEITRNSSVVYGLGLFGNYYANTDIENYFSDNKVGINVGWGFVIGTKFKLSEKFNFRILMEVQRDITKITKPNNIEIKERMNTLVGLNFIYKL
jgi:Outer membrane protein beta-barrel domain